NVRAQSSASMTAAKPTAHAASIRAATASPRTEPPLTGATGSALAARFTATSTKRPPVRDLARRTVAAVALPQRAELDGRPRAPGAGQSADHPRRRDRTARPSPAPREQRVDRETARHGPVRGVRRAACADVPLRRDPGWRPRLRRYRLPEQENAAPVHERAALRLGTTGRDRIRDHHGPELRAASGEPRHTRDPACARARRRGLGRGHLGPPGRAERTAPRR